MPREILAAAAVCLLVPAQAEAFDWNGRTVAHELDVLDGRMAIESGHPLATARGFRLARKSADADASGRTSAALEFVLGRDYDDDRSDALQTVMFGSWLNEVRTSLDMGSPDSKLDPLAWAAKFMRWRYADYLDGREHSDRWSRSTAYTSSNYQHSMQVESIDPFEQLTADDTFDLIDEYAFWALDAAALNLIVAKKGELEGTMSAKEIDLAWVAGLRYVGSVFHLLEDSAVTCSAAAQRRVPICIPGDGHTIVGDVGGRPAVVTLSNNAFYERKVEGGKPHALLDGLYREADIEEIYGAFDPAIATSAVLVQLSLGIDAAVHEELADVPLFVDGETNPDFDAKAFRIATRLSNEVFDAVIDPRFADAGQRQPLPALGDKSDDVNAEEDDEATTQQGCRTGDPSALPLLVLAAAFRRRRRTP